MNNSINYRECRRLLDKLFANGALAPEEIYTDEAVFLVETYGLPDSMDGIHSPSPEEYKRIRANLNSLIGDEAEKKSCKRWWKWGIIASGVAAGLGLLKYLSELAGLA